MFTQYGPEIEAELAYRREQMLVQGGRAPAGRGWLHHVRFAALRGRRWWTRRVPLGVGSGLLAAAAFKVGFDVLWRPFPDPLPGKALVWTGLAVAAFALAGLRTRPVRRRYRLTAVVPYAAATMVVVTGLAHHSLALFSGYAVCLLTLLARQRALRSG